MKAITERNRLSVNPITGEKQTKLMVNNNRDPLLSQQEVDDVHMQKQYDKAQHKLLGITSDLTKANNKDHSGALLHMVGDKDSDQGVAISIGSTITSFKNNPEDVHSNGEEANISTAAGRRNSGLFLFSKFLWTISLSDLQKKTISSKNLNLS